MAKYLFLYHGGAGMPEGEEAQQQQMAAWGAWFGQLGAAVLDGGNPTAAAKTISSDGAVSEGAGTNPATGYGLIDADSLDDAVQKAKGCPVLAGGGSVAVYGTIDVGP